MSELGAIRARAAVPADTAALLELFRASFGHALAPAAWEWKYRGVPGEARSVVAERGGRLLAHAGALCLPARLRGARRGIWQLVDFMGSTSGSGLRAPLVAAGRALLADLPRDSDAPWIFGFPSARHFALGERAFGYAPVGTLQPWSGDLAAARGEAAGLIELSDCAGDWAAQAWRACAVDGVERSLDFLNWRYHARPERYYRFYRLHSGTAAADGLAVFAFHAPVALAAELWLPGGGDWGPALRAVARDLAQTGMSEWRFWPPHAASVEKLLAALGCRPQGEPVFVGCCGGGGRPGVPDGGVPLRDGRL